MAEKLQVAVVGVGGIAGAHMPGWKASKDAELAAGCDLNAEVLAQWGTEHGVEKLYTDIEDLWRDESIDIVDICTPNRYHAPLSIAALKAGKHVMCEKPLAPTPGEVRQMIAARDEAGKLLMTAQSARFAGNAQAFKEEIEQGALGEVYHARCWTLRRAGVPVGPGFIQRKHSGGGPCIDMGVHMLDLALWWMGNPQPVAVSGVAVAPLAHVDGAFSEWGACRSRPNTTSRILPLVLCVLPTEPRWSSKRVGYCITARRKTAFGSMARMGGGIGLRASFTRATTKRGNTTIANFSSKAMAWDRTRRNVSPLPAP